MTRSLVVALGFLLAAALRAAESSDSGHTNLPPAQTESAPRKLDESAFRIVSERNIFNANRSGGTVRSSSSRRPARVETVALVGTMAYEKGAFAFFEGSSSEFTKVLKANGVIAGHKIVDILANAVKLEMDGQIIEVAVGTGLRREDQGAWKISDAVTLGNGGSGSGESNGRTGRDRRGEDASADRSSSSNNTASASVAPGADQNEVLKRLMERREKESQ